jgi:hypothetical protein
MIAESAARRRRRRTEEVRHVETFHGSISARCGFVEVDGGVKRFTATAS